MPARPTRWGRAWSWHWRLRPTRWLHHDSHYGWRVYDDRRDRGVGGEAARRLVASLENCHFWVNSSEKSYRRPHSSRVSTFWAVVREVVRQRCVPDALLPIDQRRRSNMMVLNVEEFAIFKKKNSELINWSKQTRRFGRKFLIHRRNFWVGWFALVKCVTVNRCFLAQLEQRFCLGNDLSLTRFLQWSNVIHQSQSRWNVDKYNLYIFTENRADLNKARKFPQNQKKPCN